MIEDHLLKRLKGKIISRQNLSETVPNFCTFFFRIYSIVWLWGVVLMYRGRGILYQPENYIHI